MLEFLNNQWTIGIGGSIISGIIVYILTERLFKRKINKEISENIKLANAEIIYAVRPLIAAKVKPKNESVASLLKSTAKKHGVSIGSLLNWNEIIDQLTKEVLENSFLTPENKIEYCESLLTLLPEESELEIKKSKKDLEALEIKREKLSSANGMAAIVAIIVGALIGIISLINDTSKTLPKGLFREYLSTNSAMIILGIIPTVIIAIFATEGIFNWFRKRKSSDELDNEDFPDGFH